MTATVYTPPSRVPLSTQTTLFLAGSIEMGRAVDWQSTVIARLSHLPVTILNPRRADWDSSWVQSKDNPQFREQVEWELDGLARADLIAMYLASGTVSPISLLELGLNAPRGGTIVYCPPGFARKGNVDIVCERCGIPVYEDEEQWMARLVEELT